MTPEQVFSREHTIAAEPSTPTGASTNKGKMAARNRPRNGAVKEDPDEELSMWNQIKRDLEKCNVIQKRAKVVAQQIIEVEEKMGKCMLLFSSVHPRRSIAQPIFYDLFLDAPVSVSTADCPLWNLYFVGKGVLHTTFNCLINVPTTCDCASATPTSWLFFDNFSHMKFSLSTTAS